MKSPFFRYLLSVFLVLSLMATCLPVQVLAQQLPPLPRDLRLVAYLIETYLSGGQSPEHRLPPELPSGETLPAEAAPEEGSQPLSDETAGAGLHLYFGQLHAHTTISDGSGTVEETFLAAARMPGLDFFAVTDHSESFDNDLSGSLTTDGAAVSQQWAAGKAAAAAVTGGGFVGIFGYEMSWPRMYQVGHVTTFASPGFQSWQQEDYGDHSTALTRYYETLGAVPEAIGQFNHPGTQWGTFQEFEHRTPESDRVMALLEAGGEEGFRYYVKALDSGWHVAPTNNQIIRSSSWADSGVRTVVCAPALTEKDLYDAIRSRRVYATEDPDLEILYSLNGHFMGSQVDFADIGDTALLSVSLNDPTDAAIGTVEVITTGGAALTSQYLAESSGTLTFSLPPEPGYYFLRITQPDGDTALTAPVWVEENETTLVITSFSCQTPQPVQNEPVNVAVEFVNGTKQDFQVQALEILADGQPVCSDTSLTTIPAQSTLNHTISFFCDCVGMTEITLRIAGTFGAERQILEQTLMLSFQQSALISAIAVDGSHGNSELDSLTLLQQQSMAEHIDLTVLREEPTAVQLEKFRFLLISAPSEPFSEGFLDALAEFADFGGTIVVCGQGSDPFAAEEGNRLLSRLGTSLRLHADLVTDDVNNGGTPEQIYTDNINLSSPWCAGISENQVYRQISGCSVEGGDWLVKGRSTTQSSHGSADVILLAAEAHPGGGTVFAAGCLFCQDGSMEEPKNIWDDPYANYTLTHALLSIGGDVIPLSTIQQAREGTEGDLFRVRGYLTAGTSNPYNAFPDTLYLQDDTGGIAVMPFAGESLQQGIAMEITGYAGEKNGNRLLKPSRWKALDADGYLYEPLEGDWRELLDPVLHGGTLMQVEGTCLEVYAREDGTLSGCLLQDASNQLARVKIEDCIGNGSDGGNELHKTIRKGRTVRAMGILHIDEFGDTVIRVRNCEEVVYVPPVLKLLTNPQTADSRLLPVIPMGLSFLGLVLLKKRPYRGRYLRK